VISATTAALGLSQAQSLQRSNDVPQYRCHSCPADIMMMLSPRIVTGSACCMPGAGHNNYRACAAGLLALRSYHVDCQSMRYADHMQPLLSCEHRPGMLGCTGRSSRWGRGPTQDVAALWCRIFRDCQVSCWLVAATPAGILRVMRPLSASQLYSCPRSC